MKRLLLVLAILLPCCGETPSDAAHDAPETTLGDDSAESPELAPTEPEGCGMVFSPEPRLLELTEAHAARWSAASGCDVRVGEGGVPVTLSQDIPRPDGTQAPGVTERRRGESGEWIIEQIKIHVYAEDKSSSVLHELGHALGADGHTEEDGVLSNTKGYTPIINEPSLTLLCSFVHCPAFAPEG